MRVTWDKRVRAVYIYLTDVKVKVDFAKKVTEDVYLDYSAERTLVGIEILNASEPLVEDIAK